MRIECMQTFKPVQEQDIQIVTPAVTLIAKTAFEPPEFVPWRPEHYDEDSLEPYDGQALIEFAGRACYESWSKPNPKTATEQGYIGHILAVNHGSVLEHAVATLYVTGVSRSLTHELVRHRAGFGFSQLSQRYVPAEESCIVAPPEMRGHDDPAWMNVLRRSMAEAVRNYQLIVAAMEEELAKQDISKTEREKRARQAARCVLPNMTETRIVVTANARAWRHFVQMRAARPADHEIREVACAVFETLSDLWPAVFQDMRLVDLDDGTRAVEYIG